MFTNRFNRFCLRHRDKGIPNLMLYVALGNAIVILLSMFNRDVNLASLLCFDKAQILNGQVWRLFTYVFTQTGDGFFDLLLLYFFYMLGRLVERSMGTLKFNLFYFSGVVLMDVFAMIFAPTAAEFVVRNGTVTLVDLRPVYYEMSYFLHLSLILSFATMHPDSQFLIFLIIPVKAWLLALLYLILALIPVYQLSYPVMFFPHNLFPLVALGNFFLFTGGDIVNVLPQSWRSKLRRKSKRSAGPKVIQFETSAGPYRPAPKKEDFMHKCTICGRTDAQYPDLEFRYCSRCSGYHCYCIDHINNHVHIEQ